MKAIHKLCLIFFIFFAQTTFAKIIIPPKTYYYYPPKIPLDNKLRKTDYPYLTSETFRFFCNHIIDETQIPFDTDKVNDGDTIYVTIKRCEYFFQEIHPFIKSKYILVTHFQDESAPRCFVQKPLLGSPKTNFLKYLNDDKLVAWFCRNLDLPDHPKMFPIPIGFWENYWTDLNLPYLEKINKNLPSNLQRSILVYRNYYAPIHPMRLELDKIIENKPYVIQRNRIPYSQYVKNLAITKFVLSPEGNGIDCYRTWEALYMGCIPIVKHSSIDALFKDLPVLLIDDWNQINENFLNQKYIEITSKKYNMDKLFAPFWLNIIQECQEAVKRDDLVDLKRIKSTYY